MNTEIKDCQSILILRPDNLGDVVLFSGTLRHIRNHFQNATISLCVKKYVQNYIEYCPYIDYVHTWDKYAMPSSSFIPPNMLRGRTYLLGWFDKLNRKPLLQYLKTDLLLVPVRSPSKGIYGEYAIVSDIPARIKIGIAGDYSNQDCKTEAKYSNLYSRCLHLGTGLVDLHELNVTAQFLQLLGINTTIEDLWPEVWTTDEDRIWAKERIPQSSTSTVLALCPGASDKRKLYPIQQYRSIFNYLNNELLTIVLFGSKSERNLCDKIQQEIKSCKNVLKVFNLAGDSTVRQLIEGLRNCDIVLSTDSASLHLSVAIKKPVVGIMGGWHYGRFYPWGNPNIHRVVNQSMDCYWCNSRCIFRNIRCIEEIEPIKIALELQSLIEDLCHAKKV
ncbi:glycosyltransferase family 9 protein [Microcystis sp. Msp_OC_L_20101000_S702]|uniref:glycosyltransferase family 9 protein n=1 Tax=Microcystis sp. Msp_OC_L_20101000_S702 TaxID=2486218 RepID=UPI00257BC034|nr:glycosyltransferase family 9 protein [Microcystis sp. Msp_OC_L_20101000_S702]